VVFSRRNRITVKQPWQEVAREIIASWHRRVAGSGTEKEVDSRGILYLVASLSVQIPMLLSRCFSQRRSVPYHTMQKLHEMHGREPMRSLCDRAIRSDKRRTQQGSPRGVHVDEGFCMCDSR
jgi:hypothetical protein